ncbi:crossover junction endodeoxyribonuclease RuvC [Schumannella luteola]|uniref:Crossover junction endodeoxyribonuclease RuvC n=1 Tax=Schumannella luteola TaxID=472059 RepID=A0A852YAV2_9MICO|nr:crossover junction endodeoxyribonuclease RuvC [Schumannella luteola]NYH00087.1 crossover junction endodeoxyribonuclease RuvC [Schumannella luteola]TPX06640.1 crossover junction endodeoxyribonuclease RuvC [Schumannella luteola]
MRVLGIDPGLTRCGVGIVDVAPDRRATLVHVGVIRTSPDTRLEQRIHAIMLGVRAALDEHRPDAVALERVFAQHNLSTVMGVAQASGVVLALAAERELRVGLHTPSEVKAAVTGYGAAEKAQVGTMVARVLRLDEIPKPADAADALALALCHAWSGQAGMPAAGSASALGSASGSSDGLTPAQRAWRDAEKRTARTEPRFAAPTRKATR